MGNHAAIVRNEGRSAPAPETCSRATPFPTIGCLKKHRHPRYTPPLPQPSASYSWLLRIMPSPSQSAAAVPANPFAYPSPCTAQIAFCAAAVLGTQVPVNSCLTFIQSSVRTFPFSSFPTSPRRRLPFTHRSFRCLYCLLVPIYILSHTLLYTWARTRLHSLEKVAGIPLIA